MEKVMLKFFHARVLSAFGMVMVLMLLCASEAVARDQILFNNPVDFSRYLYTWYLDRGGEEPDTVANLEGLANAIKSNLVDPIGAAAQEIRVKTTSQEFKNKLSNKTPEEQLDFIFSKLLYRKPSDAEKSELLPVLQSQGSDAIVTTLIAKPEFVAVMPLCLFQPQFSKPTDLAQYLYTWYLSRGMNEPDTLANVPGLVNAMTHDVNNFRKNIAHEVLIKTTSQEFKNKLNIVGSRAEDQLDLIYTKLLLRHVDDGGKNFYLPILQSQGSDAVVTRIIGDTEFISKMPLLPDPLPSAVPSGCQMKVIGDNWTWLAEHWALSAKYNLSFPPGRKIELGTGLSVNGTPKGSKYKPDPASGETEVTGYGIGTLQGRVLDGQGPCVVVFSQAIKPGKIFSSDWFKVYTSDLK
jgi:hypothetical protein